MSRIPNDLKSKYNKNDKFLWVDSQLEKFMERHKELEDKINLLEAELEKMSKLVKEYPNDMQLGSKIRHLYWKDIRDLSQKGDMNE